MRNSVVVILCMFAILGVASAQAQTPPFSPPPMSPPDARAGGPVAESIGGPAFAPSSPPEPRRVGPVGERLGVPVVAPFSPPNVLGDPGTRPARGADFVPVTLTAIVPVAPGTEVLLEGVAAGQDAALWACGAATTELVAFAVTDRSTFATSVPPSCASPGVTIRIIALSQVVAEFEASAANQADIASVAANEEAASLVYGWTRAPKPSGAQWRNAPNARPIITGAILAAISLLAATQLRSRRRFLRARLETESPRDDTLWL